MRIWLNLHVRKSELEINTDYLLQLLHTNSMIKSWKVKKISKKELKVLKMKMHLRKEPEMKLLNIKRIFYIVYNTWIRIFY